MGTAEAACTSIAELFMSSNCRFYKSEVPAAIMKIYAGARIPTSRDRRSTRKTRNVLNVKTIVAAKINAPQATWATVTEIIGFNGCGSYGDDVRVMYAATPKINCTNSKPMTTNAGRVKKFSSRCLSRTVNTVTKSDSETTIAHVI